MIWEYTWPAPRLIEAASFDNPEGQEEESEGPGEVVNLRLAGSLSTLLKQDLGSRIVEQGPVEQCLAPVALQICHQSRMHTLSRYRLMTSLAGPFYYNPQRDVIFFTIDVTDDYYQHMPFLDRYHKTELNTLETLLVLDSEWPESAEERSHRPHGMGCTLDFVSHLGSLQTIQILWRGFESCNESLMELDHEGRENGCQALANRLRSKFSRVIGHETCTAKKIEVMDLDGNLY